MWNQYVCLTQEKFHISNKELAAHLGMSQSNFSKFRRKGTDMTLRRLWELVEAMDALSPGARAYFGELVAGRGPDVAEQNRMTVEAWNTWFSQATEEEIQNCFFAMAGQFRESKIKVSANNTREKLGEIENREGPNSEASSQTRHSTPYTLRPSQPLHSSSAAIAPYQISPVFS